MVVPTQPSAPLTLSAEALFRYHVISQVRARTLGGEVRARGVRAVARQRHLCADGRARSVSVRSIYRWLRAYEQGGLAALEPARRPKTQTSCVLPACFVDFLRRQKETDPKASVPEIIRRARQLGVLKPGEEVHRCTAYRAAQRMGLPLRQRSTKRDADARRFAYPHRMQMMLCDGKYFRAGVHRRKRVALFFLDDATRYGLGAVVGASESTELFVRGLYEVIRRHGLMDLLFLDNGPGFISDDTHRVVARLASHLVLGTAGYPEGHGKIERFNQTAWAQLLRSLTAVEVDDDYGALELRLNHFLSRQYSQQPHEGLGLKTPQQAWDGDERELRFPSQRWLEERFVLTETRTVSADHILSLDGVLYEVPRGHARTVIEVRRGLLDQGVSILHRGKLVRLHPVDLEANATARRGRGSGQADDDTAKSPVTAAQLAFFRDFGPAVSAGGDFIEPVERDPSTKE